MIDLELIIMDVNGFFDSLAEWQSWADHHGHGESWRRMCELRTQEAIFEAGAACTAVYGGSGFLAMRDAVDAVRAEREKHVPS
jgi:hypothetical protein